MAVRLTILIRKKPELTHEEFHRYWSQDHPKIWLSVPIVREKLVKYSQFHVNNAVSSALATEHHLPIAPFDGGVNMWGNSVEDIMSIFQDPEYNRIVVPDEESFLMRDESQLMLGHDEDKWIDGKDVTGNK